MARTLNSQLVYEYILHCLRTTYKYFALPPKQNTTNNQKAPLSPIRAQDSSRPLACESNMVKHDLTDAQTAHDEAGEQATGCCVTEKSLYVPQEQLLDLAQVLGAKGFADDQLANDMEHLEIAHEDSDCIIEEFISGDNEEFKPSCEETESENEEEEERRECLIGNQGLDEDSESGDPAVSTSEQDIETDLQSFQNPAAALDESGLECSDVIDDKVDGDEDSTEGTDELDDSLMKLEPATPEQVFEMDNSEEEEDEEEEGQSMVYQRQNDNVINTEDELDNTYTGSGDEEAVSEEEELFISVKYKDIELQKNVEHPRVVLNKEDTATKGEVSENTITLDLCSKSKFFYEFSKSAFTKGKVITPKYL